MIRILNLLRKIMRQPIALGSSYVFFGVIWLLGSNVLLYAIYGSHWPEFSTSTRFFLFLIVTCFLLMTVLTDFNPVVKVVRRQASTVLFDSQIFESIFCYTKDAIVIFDLHGEVIKVNPMFERMYGFSLEELRGSINTIIPDEETEIAYQHFQAVASGEAASVEFQAKRMCKDGRLLDVMVTTSPLKNARDQIIGVSAIIKDITEIRKTQEILLHSEKLLAVGELAAGVAHEIRNPLTAVTGFVQLLPSATAEKQKLYCEIIQSEIKRIDGTLGELLALAKPKAVQQNYADVQEKLNEVVYLLEGQANLFNIDVRCQVEQGLPMLMCDENQLKQVFINLMKNAIESMPNGGDLTIRVHCDENFVIIHFIDTGVGISKENLQRIGSPFYTSKSTGTGLGILAIRRILVNHGGQMTISSTLGQGTTVTIALPIDKSKIGSYSFNPEGMELKSP